MICHLTTGLMLALPLPAVARPQDSLPFPPTPSGSTAGATIAESKYAPRPPERHLPADAPNIVVIMLDDVGPALPSTFGGPIHTPTMDRIAQSGITYNRFHNAAMCSPTRASILTGRNHHRVGFGQIAELANDWDGYTGHWPATTASVAKVLGYYGYSTAAFGKWHNTPAEQTTNSGPFDRWPTGRLVGFDYFYGFLAGESSQWEPALVENTVRLPFTRKEGYHLTNDITDRAVAWMRNHVGSAPSSRSSSTGPRARRTVHTTSSRSGPTSTRAASTRAGTSCAQSSWPSRRSSAGHRRTHRSRRAPGTWTPGPTFPRTSAPSRRA